MLTVSGLRVFTAASFADIAFEDCRITNFSVSTIATGHPFPQFPHSILLGRIVEGIAPMSLCRCSTTQPNKHLIETGCFNI